jgi:hypothetical protein
MAIVNWGGSTAPIVTIKRSENHRRGQIIFSDPSIWRTGAGDQIQVRIRFRATLNGSRMRAWVCQLDLENNELPNPWFYETQAHNADWDETVVVPAFSSGQQLTRFRVKAQVFFTHTMSGDGEDWSPVEKRDYTAFIAFHGDFSLSYVPITLLYCPPSQDMTNATTQSLSYGTVVTLGTSELVGTTSQASTRVRSGVRIEAPYAGEGWSSGEQSSSSQSIENGARNSVAFGYTWSSMLIADNQRAIGRSYWGPLGDIFVLLKNPWFTLLGDENGASVSVNEELTGRDTELVIVPAHRLLRPGDDPVAKRIPEATRRRILELDPFITNLDEFFPPNAATPLSRAANPYADPSRGDGQTNNRAAMLARYCISNGVEIDLSATTNIEVTDTQTNETVFEGEVSDSSGINLDVLTPIGFFQNVDAENVTGSRVRVSYQASHETRFSTVQTAKCTLIRNQNEADLRDLEIWWDKQFSTFMFRIVKKRSGALVGKVVDVLGNVIPNAKLDLVAIELAGEIDPELGDPRVYRACSDERGRFAFRNIARPGRYELRYGKACKEINFPRKTFAERPLVRDLKRVKVQIDLQKAAIWELMSALGISRKAALGLRTGLKAAHRLNRRRLEENLRRHGINPRKVAHVEFHPLDDARD